MDILVKAPLPWADPEFILWSREKGSWAEMKLAFWGRERGTGHHRPQQQRGVKSCAEAKVQSQGVPPLNLITTHKWIRRPVAGRWDPISWEAWFQNWILSTVSCSKT
jgi:hypothetical protein